MSSTKYAFRFMIDGSVKMLMASYFIEGRIVQVNLEFYIPLSPHNNKTVDIQDFAVASTIPAM